MRYIKLYTKFSIYYLFYLFHFCNMCNIEESKLSLGTLICQKFPNHAQEN